jgi:hypothetical protein
MSVLRSGLYDYKRSSRVWEANSGLYSVASVTNSPKSYQVALAAETAAQNMFYMTIYSNMAK